MKILKLLSVVLFTVTLVHVNSAVAPEPQQPVIAQVPDKTLQEYMQDYATQYDIPVEWLHNLAKCESGYRQTAVGDGGLAIGVYQYHEGTWQWFSKMYGQELDKFSYHDQTKLTAWALANGYWKHWTCHYQTGVPRF